MKKSKGRVREIVSRQEEIPGPFLLNSCSSLLTMRHIAMLTRYVSITQAGNKEPNLHFQIPKLIKACSVLVGFCFFLKIQK